MHPKCGETQPETGKFKKKPKCVHVTIKIGGGNPKEDMVPELMLGACLLSLDPIFNRLTPLIIVKLVDAYLCKGFWCVFMRGKLLPRLKQMEQKKTWEKGQTHKLLYVKNKARLKHSYGKGVGTR